MDRQQLQRSMYEMSEASRLPRIALAVVAGACILVAFWILLGQGLAIMSRWLGWNLRLGDTARRILLAVGFSIYYVRILFTEFVFLKRGVSWNETLMIGAWLLMIVLLLGIAGGTNVTPAGPAVVIGGTLFVLGSWMNSYSEYTRHVWKRKPENCGRLYTHGLFCYSRHPNYLGDLLSFSGLCMIAGRWVTVVIPVVMLAGFVFISIPVLDSHLRDHYGIEFDQYARRTRKLIPFLY